MYRRRPSSAPTRLSFVRAHTCAIVRINCKSETSYRRRRRWKYYYDNNDNNKCLVVRTHRRTCDIIITDWEYYRYDRKYTLLSVLILYALRSQNNITVFYNVCEYHYNIKFGDGRCRCGRGVLFPIIGSRTTRVRSRIVVIYHPSGRSRNPRGDRSRAICRVRAECPQ